MLSSSSQEGTGKEVPERDEDRPESRIPQVARQPYTPSRAEVQAHLPLHLEYRSWCPHCRAGKGISMQHRQNTGKEDNNLGATLSLDYCFMIAEEVEDDMRAILVCYDHDKKGLWTLPVDKKGAQDEVVK